MDHLTDDDTPSATAATALPSSPMRKVFSLDCVRRPPAPYVPSRTRSSAGRTAAYRNLAPPSGEDEDLQWGLSLARSAREPDSSRRGAYCDDTDDDDVPSCKASKFSSSANRRIAVSNNYLPPRIQSSSPDRSIHSFSDAPVVVDLTNANNNDVAAAASAAETTAVGAGGLIGTTMAILQGGYRNIPPPGPRAIRLSQALNLSILFVLLVATVADVAFDLRNARVAGVGGSNNAFFRSDDSSFSTGESSIVPPPNMRPRRVGKLGSAMIGSVTTALSPILPFAGGVDLRRGEHWGLETDGDDDTNGTTLGAVVSSGWFGSSTISGWLWPSSWENGGAEQQRSYTSSIASGIPRGGGLSGGGGTKSATSSSYNAKTKAKKSTRSKQRGRTSARSPVLAASDPYLSTQEISELSLGDVALAFRYAIESSRHGFDVDEFRSSGDAGEPLNDRMVKVVDAMDDVVAKSRGVGILPALTSAASLDDDDKEETDEEPPQSDSNYGDVDALQFCAAMRLLAEWRILRQVPEGYKGYAVGMGLGHKDVVQNVAKIEAAVHDWIDWRVEEIEEARVADMERRWNETSCGANGATNGNGGKGEDVAPMCDAASSTGGQSPNRQKPDGPRSPTLRQVLQYEIDLGVQTISKLPRLKEKSAGMGLLWVRRQLHYQTEIFDNMLLVPDLHPSAIEAVKAAYARVYDMYHGWAVQKIFNYSFQAAPDVDVIYRHMNPQRLREVTAAAMKGDFGGSFGEDDDGDSGDNDHRDGDGMKEVQHAYVVTEKTLVVEEESVIAESIMVTSSVGLKDEVDKDTDTIASTITANSSSTFEVEDSIMEINASSFTDEGANTKATDHNHNNNNVGKSSHNPWVRFGRHVASEWDKLATHVGGECIKIGRHVGGEWDKLATHVGGECDKIGKHVGGEWDKLASNVGKIFHHNNKKDGKNGGRGRSSSPEDIRGGGGGGDEDISPSSSRRKKALSGDDLDRYLSEQMKLDARRHISRYLDIARPLLDDLAALFDELNMDDPTKV